MATEMTNLDIRDFPTVSSVSNSDHVVLSLFSGKPGKMTVSLFRSLVTKGVTPSIDSEGNWLVGDTQTGVPAEGRTPEFRRAEAGVEFKYTTDDDTQWKLLISYADLRIKYEDLTEEQREYFVMHLDDLTEEEIRQLQQPAADMIGTLEATNEAVNAAEKERVAAENLRKENENARVTAERNREKDYAAVREDAVAATEAALKAAESTLNPPKIVDEVWWVWSVEDDGYVSTGCSARGRSPIVKDNRWWVWDDDTQKYSDTGVVVDKYLVTEALAYEAKATAEEASRTATDAKNAVAKLEGLLDPDMSDIVAAEVIVQVETNKTDIQGLKEKDEVLTEEEYDRLVQNGGLDYSKFYFIYEE